MAEFLASYAKQLNLIINISGTILKTIEGLVGMPWAPNKRSVGQPWSIKSIDMKR